jgi:hypothetical protein
MDGHVKNVKDNIREGTTQFFQNKTFLEAKIGI